MVMLVLAKRQQQQQQQWLLARLSDHLLLPSFRLLFTGLRSLSNGTVPEGLSPQKPKPPPLPPKTTEAAPFMVDYLVDSCGLSKTDAVKASKYLAHVKSPEKPDAVLRLLKKVGLCDEHIIRLVRSAPTILVADTKKTLEPKISALQELGFSKPELAHLVSANPNALRLRNAIPKIEFWRKILGNTEKFLRVVKNTHILGRSVEDKVNPNLSFLRSVGVSNANISRIIARRPRLVLGKLSRMMFVVEQVKRLGVDPSSRLFFEALSSISNLSETTLEAKSKLLRRLGWSGDELVDAFQSFPVILRLSEKKITKAMDFLVKEAGYDPSYIARRAVLLGYSFDKRLMPRYYVLQFLKKKGLPGGNSDLLSAMVMPEKKFVKRFIAPVSENIPRLLETYPDVNAMRNVMEAAALSEQAMT